MSFNQMKIPGFVSEFVRAGKRILKAAAQGKENRKTQEKSIKEGQGGPVQVNGVTFKIEQ